MNSFWMYMTNKDASALPNCKKKKLFQRVKKEFNGVAKSSPAPLVYIEKLPACPADLLKEFPGVYHAVFKALDEKPTRCPIDLNDVRLLDASYRCRGLGGEAPVGEKTSCSTELAPFDHLASMSGIEKLGAIMVQGLQQMQMMQMRSMGCVIK